MNPVDVIIVGSNLNSSGLVGANLATAGLGLNTFGFLFPCDGHWINADPAISTTWAACFTPETVEICAE